MAYVIWAWPAIYCFISCSAKAHLFRFYEF